jgi:GNAT superfamily N-acetyltransferase
VTTVRRATAADARDIAEVKVETWRVTYAGVMPQATLDALDIDEHEGFWKRVAATDAAGVFVAEEEGRVIGFANVGPCLHEEGTGEVYAIYVRPGSWDTGSGLALMNAGVAWLARRWPEAVLWVAEENPRARRFYERYGWKMDGERVAEVAPGARIREVLYRLVGLGQR